MQMTSTSIFRSCSRIEKAAVKNAVTRSIFLGRPETSKHTMSSLVCGLDVHKNSAYATVMSYGGEVIETRKISYCKIHAAPMGKLATALYIYTIYGYTYI